MIDKIMFIADLLRLDNGVQSRNLIANNTLWLYRILNKPIHFATKLPINRLDWSFESKFDGEKVYELIGIDSSVKSWAKTFFQKEASPEVLTYFNTFFERSLVIGFEISPFLMSICTKLNVPCINIMWDPIRFMDDIYFSFNTNHLAIYERLVGYQLPSYHIFQAAEFHRANFLRSKRPMAVEGVIIFGQMPIDRSLIHEGQIKSLEDYKPDLELLKKYGEVYYKKHPFNLNFTERKAFLKSLDVKIFTDNTNTYDLLSSDSIKKVAAMSSGTITEAYFFEKSGEKFLPNYYEHYQEYPNFSSRSCISVFNDFLNVSFWADILKPVLPTYVQKHSALAFKPNRMRNANCSYWGYREFGNEEVIINYET